MHNAHTIINFCNPTKMAFLKNSWKWKKLIDRPVLSIPVSDLQTAQTSYCNWKWKSMHLFAAGSHISLFIDFKFNAVLIKIQTIVQLENKNGPWISGPEYNYEKLSFFYPFSSLLHSSVFYHPLDVLGCNVFKRSNYTLFFQCPIKGNIKFHSLRNGKLFDVIIFSGISTPL